MVIGTGNANADSRLQLPQNKGGRLYVSVPIQQ